MVSVAASGFHQDRAPPANSGSGYQVKGYVDSQPMYAAPDVLISAAMPFRYSDALRGREYRLIHSLSWCSMQVDGQSAFTSNAFTQYSTIPGLQALRFRKKKVWAQVSPAFVPRAVQVIQIRRRNSNDD